jgi:hypothetical protein
MTDIPLSYVLFLWDLDSRYGARNSDKTTFFFRKSYSFVICPLEKGHLRGVCFRKSLTTLYILIEKRPIVNSLFRKYFDSEFVQSNR